jgi:hypothetical protein
MIAACSTAGTADAPAPAAASVQAMLASVTDDAAAVSLTRERPELENRVFVASLSGAQEVPVVPSQAHGFAVFLLDGAHRRLVYALRHDVVDPTDGHIHFGGGGESGPVVIPLPRFADRSIGVVAIHEQQVRDLEAGRLYVNVHSMAHPKGEIRGQILRPGETLFVTPLVGAEETPPNHSTATGTASVILDATRSRIHFRALSANIVPTEVHIHRGIAGVAGPVVIDLGTPSNTVEGSAAISAGEVQDLVDGLLYVNEHSAQFAKGEIRGQLLSPGDSLYEANLTGAQEVPAQTSSNTGSGELIVNAAGDELRWIVTTTATPTEAHIHQAPGGVAGPVVVPFPQLGAVMTGTTALTPAQKAELDRGLWYANVHTAAHPKGEIRGQILRPGETLYTAVLAGANEVPPEPTDATGGVGFILDATGTSVRFDGAVTNIVPTEVHIHAGAVGVNGSVVYELAFSGTTISGTQTLTAADVAAFEGSQDYVNVHSAQFPKGALRGQIVKQ